MMEIKEKAYVYIDKKLAEQYEKLETDNAKVSLFKEYIEKHRTSLKDEYEASLDAMKDDLLMFTGLNLSVREAFKKATVEAEKASYKLWEEYDKEKISIKKKTAALCDELKPIKETLDGINKTLKSISTYQFDHIIDTVRKFNGLIGGSKEMMQFLVDNYRNEVVE